MINNFDAFCKDIKKSRNVYSLKDRIVGRGRNFVQVKELITNGGKHYKLINLTKTGIKEGWRYNIETANQNLKLFSDTNYVPKLMYYDIDRLLVEWIEGEQLNHLKMNEKDFCHLGQFIGNSLRNIEIKPNDQIIRNLFNQIKILLHKNILDQEINEKIKWVLNNIALPPEFIHECICFADTALKNYVRDKENLLYYIDIFGIYSAPIGRVLAKQISMIPKRYRKIFIESFFNSIKLNEVESYLPFYFLIHIIDRIYTKSNKHRFFEKRKGQKKVKVAYMHLKTYMKTAMSGKSIDDWIFGL